MALLFVLIALLFVLRYVSLIVRRVLIFIKIDGKIRLSVNWRRVPGIFTIIHFHEVISSPWPYTLTERWQLVGLLWLMGTWQLLILLPLQAVFLPVGKMEAVSHCSMGSSTRSHGTPTKSLHIMRP
jgi:hypothetical protein